ncbi:MAG: DUF721 domain-containing protein [Candidatus Puniceispirillales bacterium]
MTRHQRGKTRRLNTLTDRLISPALRRRGISLSRIVTEWQSIAGEAATWSEPAMIRFPEGESRNGTLTVSIRSGRGPEMQMLTPMIIEGCNAVFGYAAIGRISITQSAVSATGSTLEAPPKRRKPRPISESELAVQQNRLASVKDENIRKTLDNLGKSIFRRED